MQIPDVVNTTLSEAESSIEAAGLAVGTTTTACSNTISSGNVIQSEPAAGSYLAPDSTVDLVVSSGLCASDDEPQDTPDATPDNAESVSVNDGQDTIQFQSADGTTLTECSALDNPSPNDAPDNVEFPYGFFQFTISDIAPGGSTVMTITLPAGAAPTTYYKYGPTPDNPVDHWYEFLHDGSTGAMINGNVITLYFIDGQRGDADLDGTNGVIEDPGAPAVANTDSSAAAADSGGGGGGGCFITSLSQYGMN